MAKAIRGSDVTEKYLKVVRGFALDGVKFAALGGDGQDVNFEQAFSNLAHAYLRDKAPGLLDHEVGFQLLDRNQENTKAIGVFGFKVGSNWIYAPVFFLNGDLKGHELLYLKNQDMFVPLKENWLNYILNRKPNILGEGVDKDYRKQLLQPDLAQMATSPANKMAGAKPTLQQMIDAVMPVFAHTSMLKVSNAFQELGERINLISFLKTASDPQLNVFQNTLLECPQLAAEVEYFHGVEPVINAIKTARRRNMFSRTGDLFTATKTAAVRLRTFTGDLLTDDIKPEHPIKSGKLRIITYTEGQHIKGLDEVDLEKLAAERVLIKDAREDEETSKAYKIETEQKLTNPKQTGIYQVLTKIGEFEKCLVVVHPYGPDKRAGFVTVVRLEGEKNWTNIPGNQVWVGEYLEDEFKTWIKDQKTADSLSKGMSRHMLITEHGDATCPFSVETEFGGSDGAKSYNVSFDDTLSRGGLMSYQRVDESEPDALAYDRWADGQRIHLGAKKGFKIRVNRGDVHIPEGTKIIEVRHSKYDDDEREDAPGCCGPSPSGSSDPPPIVPGNIMDAEATIMKKTSALTIYNDGLEVEINRQRMPVFQGFISLVRDHGFREGAAKELLKQAAKFRKLSCRVKYAFGGPLTQSAQGAPAFPQPEMGGGEVMGSTLPTQMSQQQEVPVDRPPTDPEVYNPNTALDRREVGRIRRAAGTGQKEIFDTAMVGSMLKAVRDDTMVDQYLGDLAKGMDRLGRILFMFYWHGDEFADRYGKSDMPELEDSLRNSFEAVGDVLMFLKQKTIEPYPEESDVSVDLGSVANN